MWLLLRNRLNTADNLLRKGRPALQGCILCSTDTTETADHLFMQCPVSQDLHRSTQRSTNIISSNQPIVEAWMATCATNRQQIWTATVWATWKERNLRIFQGRHHSASLLKEQIRLELLHGTRLIISRTDNEPTHGSH
jgi:zinc-binding in reverse transcriptase